MKLSKGQGLSLFAAFIIFGIFNIVVFVCGTFLLAMNFFFSGENFNEFVTYIALIMLAAPSLYYLVLLIKNRKK